MIKMDAQQKRLLKLSSFAVQGGLSETMRTCGNKACACHFDPKKKHGPHLYLTFRNPEGRSSGMYVPREHEKEVRKAVAAWAELWETLVAVGRRNRENLREKMRRRPVKPEKPE